MIKDSKRSETSLTYEEVIWNNPKNLINSQPVFYKGWFDQNIIRIKDLRQVKPWSQDWLIAAGAYLRFL